MIFRSMATRNQKVGASLQTGWSDYVQHQQRDRKNKWRTEIRRSKLMRKFTYQWVAHNRYWRIPSNEIREICSNVQFSSVFKKYQHEILSYLRNHPRITVEDIHNKAKHISAAMIESAQPMPTVPETTFLVRGDHTHSTETLVYRFWNENKFPALLMSLFLKKSLSFDSGYREFEDFCITTLHRNYSLHLIDTDLFKSENEGTALVRKILLFQRFIIIFTFIKCNLKVNQSVYIASRSYQFCWQ